METSFTGTICSTDSTLTILSVLLLLELLRVRSFNYYRRMYYSGTRMFSKERPSLHSWKSQVIVPDGQRPTLASIVFTILSGDSTQFVEITRSWIEHRGWSLLQQASQYNTQINKPSDRGFATCMPFHPNRSVKHSCFQHRLMQTGLLQFNIVESFKGIVIKCSEFKITCRMLCYLHRSVHHLVLSIGCRSVNKLNTN